MGFRDRTDAGIRLAQLLGAYGASSPIILALPRGGVPVAVEVARSLEAPLDLLIVRKIGVPGQTELAMGAVVDGTPPVVLKNERVIKIAGVSPAAFKAVRDRELVEARRRRALYVGDRHPPDLRDRTAIIVDDGIATGASMRVAIRAVRSMKPRQIVVATPVAPPDALRILRQEADDVVCIEEHADLGAIGYYYDDFGQVSDAEVVAALREVSRPAPADNSRP